MDEDISPLQGTYSFTYGSLRVIAARLASIKPKIVIIAVQWGISEITHDA